MLPVMISVRVIQSNRSGQHLTVPHTYPCSSVCCSYIGAGAGVDPGVTDIKHEKIAEIFFTAVKAATQVVSQSVPLAALKLGRPSCDWMCQIRSPRG